MTLRADLIDHGWCQGSLIREEDNALFAEQLVGIQLPMTYRLMVVTQTCDLVHPDLAVEPVAEVLVVTLADGIPNAGLSNCKSFRKLHLPMECQDGVARHVRARRIDVRHIPRELLQPLHVDASLRLNDRGLATLQRWLTLRYSRVALPDAFVARFDEAKDDVRDALKKVPHDLYAMYMAINSMEELPGDTPYNVGLFGVMRVEAFEDPASKTRADEAMAAIATAMQACPGIEVTDYIVVSAAGISLDDIDHLLLMNFDDLSLGTDPQEAPPG